MNNRASQVHEAGVSVDRCENYIRNSIYLEKKLKNLRMRKKRVVFRDANCHLETFVFANLLFVIHIDFHFLTLVLEVSHLHPFK